MLLTNIHVLVVIVLLGPWMMMLRATGLALEKTPIVGRAKVLDLASGAGEPGITIARQFPQVVSMNESFFL